MNGTQRRVALVDVLDSAMPSIPLHAQIGYHQLRGGRGQSRQRAFPAVALSRHSPAFQDRNVRRRRRSGSSSTMSIRVFDRLPSLRWCAVCSRSIIFVSQSRWPPVSAAGLSRGAVLPWLLPFAAEAPLSARRLFFLAFAFAASVSSSRLNSESCVWSIRPADAARSFHSSYRSQKAEPGSMLLDHHDTPCLVTTAGQAAVPDEFGLVFIEFLTVVFNSRASLHL